MNADTIVGLIILTTSVAALVHWAAVRGWQR